MTWRPRIARFPLISRFRVPCYWCGLEIRKGETVAYYPDERQSAHARCHGEACP